MTYQERINATTSLDQLAELLNEIREEIQEEEARSPWPVDDGIRFDELPTFGGPDLKDTGEVWSWDETHLLVLEGKWYTIPRCPVCGEADFHCGHDEETT